MIGVFLLAFAEGSSAQPIVTSADTPALEVSADLGVFGLSPHHPTGLGIHVTRNYSPVLGMEVGVTGEQRNSERPGNVLLTVNGRFRVPDVITGRDVFATFGGWTRLCMTFRYSPMIGLGIRRRCTIRWPVRGLACAWSFTFCARRAASGPHAAGRWRVRRISMTSVRECVAGYDDAQPLQKTRQHDVKHHRNRIAP